MSISNSDAAEIKIPFYTGTDNFLEKKRYMEKIEGMEYVRFEEPMDRGPLLDDGNMIFRRVVRCGAATTDSRRGNT